jgi:hypothetical protein
MKLLAFSIALIIALQTGAQVTSVAPAPVPRNPGAPSPPSALPSPSLRSAKSTSYRSSRSSVPPVVVQFSASDPSRIQEMSEDLDVMTHIIDRTLSEDVADDSPPDKMGIKMYVTGSSRSVRALYVEDFGALFMIKVNFPLQGPPAEDEKVPEKTADSEWERARRELLGEPDPGGWPYISGSAAVDFDPKRVDAMKKLLIRALKNATNVRHLKGSEVVSLSVFGGAPRVQMQASKNTPRPTVTTRPRTSSSGGAYAGSGYGIGEITVYTQLAASGGVPGTVLTLRVKKSDIDAFAKGDIDEDAFTKAITFNSYTGAGHDVTSVNSWVSDR